MKGIHFLFGEMDMFDQLLLLLVGIVVLLVNLGLMSVSWLAYWPVLLIVIALKEMLQNK
jgi:hypothetical protein